MNCSTKYKLPNLTLLNRYEDLQFSMTAEEQSRKADRIRDIMAAYRIKIEEGIRALPGPAISEYQVALAPGTRPTRIRALVDDIALAMGAIGVRISVCPDSIILEIPNDHRSTVPLRSLLEDKAFRESTAELPIAIGSTKVQSAKVIDLVDAPHILVAGATKQGKSVCIHSMVASLLFSKRPDEVKFVFIDPKMSDFSEYGALQSHYLCVLPGAPNEGSAIVTSPQDAANVLEGLCAEMEDRYNTLLQANANNIRDYNRKAAGKLPYIVCFIGEYGDLTVAFGAKKESKELSKRITASIIRLAQRGRAAGIHLILTTQRPSRNVITGLIKANFPTRIAFRTASKTDSANILDMPGAEKLTGRGDMLLGQGANLERMQCGYISMEEVSTIVEYVGAQKGTPETKG